MSFPTCSEGPLLWDPDFQDKRLSDAFCIAEGLAPLTGEQIIGLRFTCLNVEFILSWIAPVCARWRGEGIAQCGVIST